MLPFFGVASSNSDFYARGLGYALRASRLYDPDDALRQDPSFYDKIRKDAVVAFALNYRRLLAAGEDWSVLPASPRPEDKEVAAIIEGMIRQISGFNNARVNLAEAIITGSRWAAIEGDKKLIQLGSQQALRWWVCTGLKDIDKRRFRRMPEENSVPGTPRKYHWEINEANSGNWIPIERSHYVKHTHDDSEQALGFGSGLASSLYLYVYAKDRVLVEGLNFVERWSNGVLHAAVDSLRDGQASTLASTRATAWLDELEKMRSRHVLVHDKNDELNLIDAPAQGWNAATEALAYLDGAIRVLILGASLPTESEVEGGSFAMAKVQQSSTAAIIGHDRAILEEAITNDLIKNTLWRINLPILQFCGLGNAQPPTFKIRDVSKLDPSVRADVLLKCRQAGMRIKLNEAYEQTGWEVPNVGDECLEPEAPPQPGMPPSGPDLNVNGLSPEGNDDRPSDKPALESERFEKGTDALAEKNALSGPNPKLPGKQDFSGMLGFEDLSRRLEKLEAERLK